MEMYNLFFVVSPGFMCDFSTCDYHAMSYREIYILWVSIILYIIQKYFDI